ncbi:uncharacterized protein RSE6_09512 [Rhynchosporium secalis]|uniref:Uncharacterized protein n=1 Tax=Rhynchosporium secalis TaxID=38038 RepID=A0A1E1MJA1_RHYSE|nr:uncharacterized protein RSE6_09512 [Rhynchosporium secalis]
MAAPSPSLTSYGATATTFLTTTITLYTDQASFIILFPAAGTEHLPSTTLPRVEGQSSTYTPSALPVLILTNVVGIAVNPSGLAIATRTLSQSPVQVTSTNTDVATSSQIGERDCLAWNCWSRKTHIGIAVGAGLGALLLAFLIWWTLIRRPRIKKIRIRSGKPGDEEKGADIHRPPLKISIKTSMSRTRSQSRVGKKESLTPPLPNTRGDDDGIRIIAGDPDGRTNAKEPQAYRVVRQPSPRQFFRPVSMPFGPAEEEMDRAGDRNRETRTRDLARPMTGAAADVGVGSAMRTGRRGNVLQRDVRLSREESMGGYDGSRRTRQEIEDEMRERSERRRDRQKAQRPEYGRNRSQSHTHVSRREHEGRGYGERRRHENEEGIEEDRHRHSRARRGEENFEFGRGRVEEGIEDGRSRRSYDPRGEGNFEVRRDRAAEDIDGGRPRRSYDNRGEEDSQLRRDRSPKRRESVREDSKHRLRSVSHDRQDRSNDKEKKRRNSESGESGGLKAGLKKLVPLLPLVLGLMTTYAEPKGGWDQYIPEEKRKGKGKLKKMAEDVFDKHHHKIPEDFPRHIYNPSSKRSKSADRAPHRSSHHHRRDSPSPPRRRETIRDHHRSSRRDSRRLVGSDRQGYDGTTPENESGDSDSVLTPSPPPRRHRSTRERRPGGYDGADDDDFVVYPDGGEKDDENVGVEEIVRPYEISEPDVPILNGAKTFPMSNACQRWEENRTFSYTAGEFLPPTTPSTIR